MFIDEAEIFVQGGNGGAGLVAFRREKFVPFGGPAGGDGGKGGDVILEVNRRLNTLSSFRHHQHFTAENGHNGGNFNRTGALGRDKVISVPPGTIVSDASTESLLADLTQPGERIVIARGGRGGRGNARFKTSINQAPRMAEKGEPGEHRRLHLELKLIADVGIVGVPNAGKSTLLSVVTAARPKIADYPFTTLVPILGIARIDDREILLADLPGLIEGAHAGAGLGRDFLKHIQRTRLLIHLLNGLSTDVFRDFVQIQNELSDFDPGLRSRPQIVVLNKIDQPEVRALTYKIQAMAASSGYEFHAISAVTHEGVRELMSAVVRMLDTSPSAERVSAFPVYHHEADEGFKIVREGRAFRVTGTPIERAAAMTYWEYDEAIARFQRTLYSLGIAQALRDKGIRKGDTVLIGEHELEWSE